MGVARQHHIHMAFLGDRCDMHFGIRIGNRVMHHQDPEFLVLILGQVILQPLDRLLDLLCGRGIHLPA